MCVHPITTLSVLGLGSVDYRWVSGAISMVPRGALAEFLELLKLSVFLAEARLSFNRARRVLRWLELVTERLLKRLARRKRLL